MIISGEPTQIQMEELERQHIEDQITIDCLRKELNFYRELFKYLTEESVGNSNDIIKTVSENIYNGLEGYVKVKKEINDKQHLILTFKNSNGEEYKATWHQAENYAVWENGGGYTGDDYHGYLLFPTFNDDTYFCIEYNC